jgi:hypothetical protein
MAVASMVGEYSVLRLKGPGHSNADEFLPYTGMDSPEKLALPEKLQQPLFGPSDCQRQADFPLIPFEQIYLFQNFGHH